MFALLVVNKRVSNNNLLHIREPIRTISLEGVIVIVL